MVKGIDKVILLLSIILLIFLAGWDQQLPLLYGNGVEIQYKQNPFTVHYHVKGNNLFIECIVTDVSFRENSKKQAKIELYVDGKKVSEFRSAAFVVKNMPRGPHHIKLEVVKENGEPYYLWKEFSIFIR